jgi:hypothetical protein
MSQLPKSRKTAEQVAPLPLKLGAPASFWSQRSLGIGKDDPLLATFNAVAWMSANPASSQPSVFVI